MATPEFDARSPTRRAADERIASETPLPALDLPAGTPTKTLEDLLPPRRRKPVAVAGVVENGLVRPLDPSVKLAEHSRVVIVATEGA